MATSEKWRSPLQSGSLCGSLSSSSSSDGATFNGGIRSNDTPTTCSLTTTTGNGVQVPQDGWYAFFWTVEVRASPASASANDNAAMVFATLAIESDSAQPKDKDKDKDSNDKDSDSNDNENQDKSPCNNSNYDNSSNVRTRPMVSIDLPLRDKEGIALQTLDVGMSFYLTRGARLTVLPAAAATAGNFQWRLVHQYSTSTTPPALLLGTPSPRNKNILCSICGRSFPAVRSVQHHMVSMHRDAAGVVGSTSTERQHRSKRKRSSNRNGNENDDDDDDDDDNNANDKDDDGCSSHDPHLWTRPLSVIYNDAFMAVVDKPQGMAVMGSKPSLQRSDLLMALVGKDSNDDALGKPRAVHRLDAATGGLLVVAKTRSAESSLKQSFAQRNCHKRYRALVHGKLELPLMTSADATMDKNNDKDKTNPSFVLGMETNDEKTGHQQRQRGVIHKSIGGKPAQTLFLPVRHVRSSLQRGEWLTLVDLWPVTGRRHQLRRHMMAVGHGILGDPRYTSHKTAASSLGTSRRLCLWATEISLPHPHTGQRQTFQMPLEPEWLTQVMRHEQEAW